MNANMEPKNHKSNHVSFPVSVDANRLFCHPNKAQKYLSSLAPVLQIHYQCQTAMKRLHF